MLEDQRQQAIPSLSQYMGCDRMSTEGNGITLTTSDGAVLVSGGISYAVTTAQVNGTTHVLAGPASQDITQTVAGGALGGTLAARDGQLPAFRVRSTTSPTPSAHQSIRLNTQGIDGNGNLGRAYSTFPQLPLAQPG